MWPRLIERWKGVTLTLIGVVATVWLALTGQLAFYIHPRYFVFTAIMAVIGGVCALAALALVPLRGESDDDDHDHDDAPSPRRRWRTIIGTSVAVAIIAVATVALIVLPPATLTASTAVQRDIDRTTADLAGDAPSLTGADPSTFTVKDWALLLRQNDDPATFDGQLATLSGFISPAPDDPDDTFYVARFTVTCCAVDAQPVGVPVHLPDWKEQFEVDDWVEVSGGFATDPAGSETLVLMPDAIEPIEQPAQPYVF